MFLTAEKALFGAEDTCCCMEKRRTSGQFNRGTTLKIISCPDPTLSRGKGSGDH